MDFKSILNQIKSKFDAAAIGQIIDKIPIANLIPILVDLCGYVPKAYESLSPEEKAALVAAALKLAAQYGGGGKTSIPIGN